MNAVRSGLGTMYERYLHMRSGKGCIFALPVKNQRPGAYSILPTNPVYYVFGDILFRFICIRPVETPDFLYPIPSGTRPIPVVSGTWNWYTQTVGVDS